MRCRQFGSAPVTTGKPCRGKRTKARTPAGRRLEVAVTFPNNNPITRNAMTILRDEAKRAGSDLRTETTINDTYDFGAGRLIRNLPKLRHIGFAANRRVLEVETISHDNRVGAQAFDLLHSPAVTAEGQRASALRFGDRRVQALFAVLALLCLKIEGFRNRQLRPSLAQMLGFEETEITQGKMSYDLRRLRLHGLIERIEKSHRYRVTSKGLTAVHFYHRLYTRLLRPALSVVEAATGPHPTPEEKPLQLLHSAMDRFIRAQAA